MKNSDRTLLCMFGVFFFFICFPFHARAQDLFMKERLDMVQKQILSRGISSSNIIDAMSSVERHLFVPENMTGNAYDDGPLPIGYGQTISQPYIVAYMTDILDLDKEDKVLEIGTGSGYQAAVLAEICDSVFTIELVPQLGERAGKLLQELGYQNICLKVGDGYQGWSIHSPFDAIIVTCAPRNIPQALKDQLKDGGQMIIPVGEGYIQELVLLEKKKGKIRQKSVLPVRFVPMVDKEGNSY